MGEKGKEKRERKERKKKQAIKSSACIPRVESPQGG